jgi:hypothetical protein
VVITALGADIVDRLDRKALKRIVFATGDFLERPPIPAVHNIICNPPYDLISEFCELAIEIATNKVAMLVPLRRLAPAHWLERLPLETIWIMTPRPTMLPGTYIAAGNKPGGGKQDFCWLVFRKGLIAWVPRLRWLHRDREVTTNNSSFSRMRTAARKGWPHGTRPALSSRSN